MGAKIACVQLHLKWSPVNKTYISLLKYQSEYMYSLSRNILQIWVKSLGFLGGYFWQALMVWDLKYYWTTRILDQTNWNQAFFCQKWENKVKVFKFLFLYQNKIIFIGEITQRIKHLEEKCQNWDADLHPLSPQCHMDMTYQIKF